MGHNQRRLNLGWAMGVESQGGWNATFGRYQSPRHRNRICYVSQRVPVIALARVTALANRLTAPRLTAGWRRRRGTTPPRVLDRGIREGIVLVSERNLRPLPVLLPLCDSRTSALLATPFPFCLHEVTSLQGEGWQAEKGILGLWMSSEGEG